MEVVLSHVLVLTPPATISALVVFRIVRLSCYPEQSQKTEIRIGIEAEVCSCPPNPDL